MHLKPVLVEVVLLRLCLICKRNDTVLMMHLRLSMS